MKFLLLIPTLFLFSLTSSTYSAIAERPEETAPQETRIIDLEQFGIRMKIPQNHRAMLRDDGSVQIIDEATYAVFRCNAIEPNLCYGGGYSFLELRLLPNSKNSLLERRVGERLSGDNCYSPFVSPLSLNNMNLLIANCDSGMGTGTVRAWFYVPNFGVIEITNGMGSIKILREELMDYLRSVQYVK